MSTPTIGSLCSGYGGLDLAVEGFFGARTAWFSEFDPAPSKVLAHHWPDVPNLGDMTRIDWSAVEPVDIIAGGTPCQDLSGAGKRKGMTEGTRSNLWVQMREAVAVIRPSIVIWENVRGAFSAYAASEVELEEGLLGVYGLDRPALRALGRVLGDLSDLGYDTEWVGVRASDAGAPHARFRVFVLAYAPGVGRGEGWAESARVEGRPDDELGSATLTQDADLATGGERWESTPGQTQRGRSRADAGGRDRALDPNRGNGYVSNTTPWWAEDATTADADRSGRVEHGRAVTVRAEHATTEHGSAPDWGVYEPAIERWEQVLGRFAPAPTEQSTKGSHRLSPAFVEWMMGLPEGHVTSPEIGLTRNQQLKALGNGVVPQQAVLALSITWSRVLDALSEAVAA